MRRFHLKMVLLLALIACLVFNASAEAPEKEPVDYEAMFSEMELEDLIPIYETLTKVINQKKLQNATLSIEPSSLSLPVGGRTTVSLIPDGREITQTSVVEYSSSDEAIAVTNNYGAVAGKSAGNAEIKASVCFEDGAVLEAKVPIEVYVPATSIQVPQTYGLFIGEGMDIKDIIKLYPETTEYKHIHFSVDNEEVATVDENGIIKTLSVGRTVVTITADGNEYYPVGARCVLSVNEPVKSIQLDTAEFNVGKGNRIQLNATVGPEEATDKSLVWKSDDETIAGVSATGVVYGVKSGTTTIRCTANDGSGISASAKVHVITAVSQISFTKRSVLTFVNKSERNACTFYPEDATDKSVNWTSSDALVAQVDSNGNVKGRNAGTATITATAKDGSNVSASYVVYVEPALPFSVERITWQTQWGQKSGQMGIEGTSLCKNKTITGLRYKVKCHSLYTGETVESYEETTVWIQPGYYGKGQMSRSVVSGFVNAKRVEVTIVSVTFDDGTVYYVPEEYQSAAIFDL